MTPQDFAAAMEATWPALAYDSLGPWRLRTGGGGGKRVSAASAEAPWQPQDIPQAEAAMRALGQEPLFVIWPQDGALDQALAARGYRVVDPVVGYHAPIAAFAPPAPLAGFAHWPPLEIAREIWEAEGIGPGRQAVMARVEGPKAAVLGRLGDRPAGVGFVAVAGRTAMLHALEVRPDLRRQGVAGQILRAAALWAGAQGADRLALAVTEANSGARALYASLGMQPVGQYHYRAE